DAIRAEVLVRAERDHLAAERARAGESVRAGDVSISWIEGERKIAHRAADDIRAQREDAQRGKALEKRVTPRHCEACRSPRSRLPPCRRPRAGRLRPACR